MKYQYVIFDVDGTLLDTREGIVASIKHTLATENLRTLTEEELTTFLGPPVMESFARYFGQDKALIDRMTKTFRTQYSTVDLLKAEVYSGLEEVCKTLTEQGIKLGVATYKRQDYAERIVKHFPVGKYFKVIYGADPHNKLKKSDIIALACKDLGASSLGKVLMIGDTEFDAIGAKQQGIDFLGVTYGFGFKTKEEVMRTGAIGWVSTPQNIREYLL